MKIKKTGTETSKAKGPKAAAKAAARAAAPSRTAKTAVVTVPVPEPAPAPRAAKDTAPAVPSTSTRNLSETVFPSDHPVFAGRRARIMEYQDWTFVQNAARPEPLTAEALCADWQREFPRAVRFTASHVKGAHRDFLVNRHSGTFAKLTAEAAVAAEVARQKAAAKGKAKAA